MVSGEKWSNLLDSGAGDQLRGHRQKINCVAVLSGTLISSPERVTVSAEPLSVA